MADTTEVSKPPKGPGPNEPGQDGAGDNAPAAPREKMSKADEETFKKDLVAAIPHLRAFARSLCNDPTQADDLAQEAMAKAWKARDSFEPGTSIKAWTFMILRNQFYSEKRRSWRTAPLDMEMAENTLLANDNPTVPMELLELRAALAKLPDDQREALILVGAGGMAYEEAAQVCQCAVGTIKSRVSRARRALETLLTEAGSRQSHDHDIRADEAFNDILQQASTLAAGGGRSRGD